MLNKDLYKAAVNDIKVNEDLIKELSIKMKNKPNKINGIAKYGVIAASVAVLLIAAVLVQNKMSLFTDKKITQLNAGETITLSKGRGNIYINKIEGIKSSKLFIPEDASSKDYTIKQLAEFFGRDPMPAIPEEYKPAMDTANVIFDHQGKMLFMSSILYSTDINNPDSPSIDIKLNKDALPPKDCLYNTSSVKESTIGSTKAVIGTIKMGDKFDANGNPAAFYDVYSAQFIYNGIGYDITAKRTDAQTFINIINSIIK